MQQTFILNDIITIFAKKLVNNTQMNRINEVLDKRSIKQTWLAEQLGKSFNAVNTYAQNRSQPPVGVLYKIAAILDINPKELLEDPSKYNK